MNARLYDPTLGRFLSPDPYVQAPDFTQSFNRYSYVFNNPLRYVDVSGEYTGWDDVIAILIGGLSNWLENGCKFTWEGLCYFAIGAASGWACLYAPEFSNLIMGLESSLNSIVSQGFGTDGKWNWSDINLSKAGASFVQGFGTSYVGGNISKSISGLLDPIVSKIPGKAWANMVQQSISTGAAGFVTGAMSSGMDQYTTTGQISWDKVWASARKSGLSGLAIGTTKGVAEGVIEAHKLGENPWALREQDLSPKHIKVQYQSLGAQSKPFDAKRVNDSYLKQNGIDAHELKLDYLGRDAKISRYDLYLSKEGQIIIYGKGGKGVEIPTDTFIRK